MKILIVDDERNARTLIKEYIADLGYDFEIFEAENAVVAGEMLQTQAIDLLFLDIGLPEKSGMEMITETSTTAHVIFTTAYQEFAIQAFEIQAVDYLLKPFGKARFKDAIERVLSRETQDVQAIIRQTMQQLQQGGNYIERIAVRTGSTLAIIKAGDIVAIEAFSDYCKIIKNDRRSFLDTRKMHYYEAFFDPDRFVRIHRSTIINLDYLETVKIFNPQKMVVKLQGGLQYDVSKNGQKRLKEIGSV